MTATIRKFAASIIVMAAISACADQPSGPAAQDGLIAARDRLVADLQQCTQAHGYDPHDAASLPETALAPNELPWRQCAYDAVRAYAQSHPSLRGMYEQLIAEDIAMTTAIQQGTMTRTQRRQRIDALVAQIKAAEEEQIAAAASEQARQNEQLRNVVDNFRGFSY